MKNDNIHKPTPQIHNSLLQVYIQENCVLSSMFTKEMYSRADASSFIGLQLEIKVNFIKRIKTIKDKIKTWLIRVKQLKRTTATKCQM